MIALATIAGIITAGLMAFYIWLTACELDKQRDQIEELTKAVESLLDMNEEGAPYTVTGQHGDYLGWNTGVMNIDDITGVAGEDLE